MSCPPPSQASRVDFAEFDGESEALVGARVAAKSGETAQPVRTAMDAAVQTPDALVIEIGRLILSDERIRDSEWDGISIVAIVSDGAVQVSAYRYDAAGEATPSTPRNFEIGDRFEELQQAMAASEPRAWKSCLARIRKPDLKMKMDFEYDDALRWKVSPANLAAKVDELRPR